MTLKTLVVTVLVVVGDFALPDYAKRTLNRQSPYSRLALSSSFPEALVLENHKLPSV